MYPPKLSKFSQHWAESSLGDHEETTLDPVEEDTDQALIDKGNLGHK